MSTKIYLEQWFEYMYRAYGFAFFVVELLHVNMRRCADRPI